MKKVKVGINGFGRIGRIITRQALSSFLFDVVAINTRSGTPENLSYLLKYDSTYRTLLENVKYDKTSLYTNSLKIYNLNYSNPKDIPWNKYGVDIVIDCTGAFKTRAELQEHIKGDVKKVILTAPTHDDTIPHVVLGINDSILDWPNINIVSNASCTTNCATFLFKILHDAFGVESGFLNTAHAYTSTQQLLDNTNDDKTRSRAAPQSIIPSTTGASDAIEKIIPDLKGKIGGLSLRVPVATVSISDVTCQLLKKTTAQDINMLFKKQSQHLSQYLSYAQETLVSSDYIGSPFSCIFDPFYTKVLDSGLVKVMGWYDNEWGYSRRIVDLVGLLSLHL